MALRHCFNIEDLRIASRRRLPKGLFEFIDRATEDDVAMRANRADFQHIRLAPRFMVDVSQRSTGAELFGRKFSMPLVVGPAGPAGFFWDKGELAIAQAAAEQDVPFVLSTYSTTPMEDIVATGVKAWFQLYLWNDRSLSHALLARALAAGFEALVVTVDTPLLGKREYLDRNGFKPPFKATPKALADMMLHPRWLAGVPLRSLARGTWPRVVAIPAASGTDTADMERRTTLSQNTTWDDIRELRALWPKTLIVKGILRREDAVRAVQIGCDGIVVSNHGGRNLDSAVSSISALPAISDAVGRSATVMMDGGIRRGSDIVKALASGAAGVLVGRPVLYGVSVGGQRGASHALELLRSELDATMALTGCPAVSDIDRSLIAECFRTAFDKTCMQEVEADQPKGSSWK